MSAMTQHEPTTWTVKVFGPLARLAGRHELAVEIHSAEPNVAALRNSIGLQYPVLVDILPSCRIAVNHAFAEEERPIRTGDELALIGMVSGG
jgi:molybdopterin converting factor small subunit